MKVRLLANDFVMGADLKKQLAAEDAQIAILEDFPANLNRSSSSMTPCHGALCVEQDSARTTVARGERVMHDLLIGSASGNRRRRARSSLLFLSV